ASDGEENASSGDAVESASLPETEDKMAGAQFVGAEPDDFNDLDERLPDIQRAIIKEFNQFQRNVAPHAIRYINDQESLPSIQIAVVKKFNQSPSSIVPDAIRYINSPAQEAIDDVTKDIVGQLYNLMFFESERRDKTLRATQNDDDVIEHHGNRDDISEQRNTTKVGSHGDVSQRAGLVSHVLTSNPKNTAKTPTYEHDSADEYENETEISNSKDNNDEKQLPMTHDAKKTLRDVQALRTLVETGKKYHRRKHNKKKFVRDLHFQKHHFSKTSKDTVTNTPDSTVLVMNAASLSDSLQTASTTNRGDTELETQKHRHTKSKRDVHGLDKKHSARDDDYWIKRTQIFSDIATAFRHMNQSKGLLNHKTKKYLLGTHEKEKHNVKFAKKPVRVVPEDLSNTLSTEKKILCTGTR
ncbi:hypothetical protein QZH41_017351, partial [Actinostola sp. cb2023]